MLRHTQYTYTVTGNRGNDTVRVIYDTGAKSSFVRWDVAENLGDFGILPSSVQISMPDTNEKFTVDKSISLDVDVDGTRLMHHFFVVDNLDEELVIGSDMIRRFKISLDAATGTVSVDPNALRLTMRAPTSSTVRPIRVSGE